MSVNKIGLGTVQFGMDYGISNNLGKTSFDESQKIVNILLKNNINYIDTASAYGNAEKILGNIGVNKFNIISKFRSKNIFDLETEFSQTLKDLKSPKLYGYLSHNPDDLISNPLLWNKLIEFKKRSLIDKIGFSFNNIKQIDEVIKKNLIPDLVQIPYNLFDQRFLKKIYFLKNKYSTEIHSRSVFLQGLFFMKEDELHGSLNEFKENINYLNNICNYDKQKILSLAINFCLNNEIIDKVIIGTQNANQLNEIINSVSLSTEIDIENLNFINNSKIKTLLDPSKW